jgi:hypothetical protein
MWIVEGACIYTRDAGFDVVEREELETLGCQASWAVQWYLVLPSGFSRRVYMYMSEA